MITNTSCTVFHLEADGTFSRTVIPACYFRETKNLKQSGNTAESGDEIIVLIPSESLSGYGGTWKISKKDYICRGTVDFELTQKNAPELRKLFEAYAVTSCEELFYGSRRLWHLKIGGK